ncbi:hypothetical protein OO17_02095 [Rhodopseudomonas palustris]|uniref:Polysaccharide biosynthesis protein n=2 Tax=Nitrobacteraceae TaxID=41294 RepID=A0A0D7F846_RHOPL|nr:hypothetical protein OO17_02095 [Rhodopseudomonas palustris]
MIFCRFLLILFISRYLDLATLGLFGLASGFVAMAPAVTGLGMVHVIMRDAVTMAPVRLTDALRHYWTYTIGLYAVVLAISGLAAAAIGAPIWVVVVAIALFEQLGNDIFQLLSNLERPLLANFTGFLRGAAWILVYLPLALGFPALRSLDSLLLFWLIGAATSVAVFAVATRTWPWIDAFRLPFRLSWLKSLMRSSLVIYASDLSYIASQYIDRYLVTLFLGLELTGVYMLYWTAANAIYTFVSMTVLQQQRPILIKAHHQGDAAHREQCIRLVRAAAIMAVAVGLAVTIGFEIVLPLLRQPLASLNIVAFWLIVAGIVARCIADWGAMALFSARRDRVMTATNLVAIALLSFFQVVLLPLAGLAGAGIALLLTFGAIAGWRYKLVFLRQ